MGISKVLIGHTDVLDLDQVLFDPGLTKNDPYTCISRKLTDLAAFRSQVDSCCQQILHNFMAIPVLLV